LSYLGKRQEDEESILMMDRERQEKDLQEVFETTQESYRAAIENTFALQEQTLEFARNLLEAPVETLQTQAESNRVRLEALAEQSKKQREAMEKLVGEASKVYEVLLQTPFSHHQRHPKFEEAIEAPEVSSEGS
jgi:uncharacterized protein (DUF342 family)